MLWAEKLLSKLVSEFLPASVSHQVPTKDLSYSHSGKGRSRAGRMAQVRSIMGSRRLTDPQSPEVADRSCKVTEQ